MGSPLPSSRAPRLGEAPLPVFSAGLVAAGTPKEAVSCSTPPLSSRYYIYPGRTRPPGTSAPRLSGSRLQRSPSRPTKSRSAPPISSSASMKSLRYDIFAAIPIGRVAPAAGGGNGKWGPAKGTWLPDATLEPAKCQPDNPATQFRNQKTILPIRGTGDQITKSQGG